MKQTNRLSLQEISELYARFQSSGLNLAEFARQEDIPYSRLIHYKRRLFQAELLPSPSTSNSQGFLQLFPSSSSKSKSVQNLLLRCSSFELEIAECFNPTLLSSVLEVLKHHA